MLTILHTADWHLGQSFHGYSREPEHAAFLQWLLLQLQELKPHALLLAGDVFDTIHPAAKAQKLFYEFLAQARVLHPALQLVITAGNHDAGSRLEAPAGLLDSFNIRIVGTPLNADGTELDLERLLVPLRGDSGQTEAIVIAMPFLRPADVPSVPDSEDPWLAGIRAAYHQAVAAAATMRDTAAPQAALIAIGHCHLAGGLETQDSERRLVVGNAEAIGLDTFPPDLAYVALGHLHRAQQFQQGRIRYSGSPIPLSFTEAGYLHQIMRLDFAGGQLQAQQSLPVPRTLPLLSVPERGAVPLEDILPRLRELQKLPDAPLEQQPFLRVNILATGPDPTRRQQIEQALQNCSVRLVQIHLQSVAERNSQTSAAESAPATADLSTLTPASVLTREYQRVYATDPPAELLHVLNQVLLQEELAG
ncbi:MAG: exonuclease SbcCD subunit D C-terminal domain-containing protein [Planctomyces sp.]